METSVETDCAGRGQAEGSKTTQFKPGHPGRRHGGRKPRPPSQLLRDMRSVYSQDETKDRTPGQKLCRQILKEDSKAFFAHLAKLESSHEAGISKEKAAQPKAPAAMYALPDKEEVDEGSERAKDLAIRLLKEIGQRVAKEDAELAKRPNAAAIGASLQNSLKDSLEREKRLRERVEELERNAAAKARA